MKITVNGVDKTAYVRMAAGATIGPMKVSELSSATLQFNNGYAPARGDAVLVYEQDNVTLLFGGIVRKRTATSIRHRGSPEMVTDVEIDDWWTYLDTSTPTSRVYTTATTLKTALTDIIADCGLGALGITLDAGQPTGPTFPAFAWNNTRASDAVRTLSTWTGASGYVARINAAKVIAMFVPGTDPAPYTVTDAATHCEEISWTDPDTIEYDAVVLWCGPAGPISYTNTWIQAGAATSWVADIPAQDNVTAGYVTVGGIFKTLSYVGGGGMYEWDYATRTLYLGTDGLPSNGTVITLVYNAASPFEVTSGSGARVFVGSAPTALTLADGQRTADGLYAQLAQAPITWSFLSHQTGWLPGQGLTVNLTTPAVNTTMVIGPVSIRLMLTNLWKYSFSASESVVYPPTSDEQWRALLSGGTPSTSSAIVSTIPPSSGSMTPLPPGDIYVGNGGSIATAVPMTGDIGISSSGVTAIQSGVIVNADINASAAIVDTKLATIATAGKVSNSATTATVSTGSTSTAQAPNTIVLRDSNSDIFTRAYWGGYCLVTQYLESPVLQSPGNITLSAGSGNIIAPPGQQFTTGTYASGFAGAGYTLNQNVSYGSASFLELDRMTVRGIMTVYELVVSQIRATNGSIFIANTGRAKTVTSLGGSSYRVDTEGSHGFAANDLIRAQRFTTAGGGGAVYQSDLTVSSVGSATQFDATLAGGAAAPAAGMDFVRLGNTSTAGRQASIYMTADDAGAPFIQFQDGVTSFATWNTAAKIRGRIGNLNGSYGYSSDIYGAVFGTYGGAFIAFDPTNGARIGYNTTEHFKVDASGNAFFAGDVKVGTGGSLSSGASAYGTGTGWWLDYNSGTPRFRVGNTSGNIIAWDGTNIGIRSGFLTVDFSDAVGNVSIGSTPLSVGRLRVASGDDTSGTYGLIATNASGIPGFFTLGDGTTYIHGPLYMSSVVVDTTGAGTNAGMTANGPFGTGVQPMGWMYFVLNGVNSWLPIYQ